MCGLHAKEFLARWQPDQQALLPWPDQLVQLPFQEIKAGHLQCVEPGLIH